MRYILLQHSTPEQIELLEFSRAINQPYAEKCGFEYISNTTRRCPERGVYWEKIAFIREILSTVEEGSLIIWEDSDSLNICDDLKTVLPTGGIFGMVQMRAGLGGRKLINWYNAGFLAMINCADVRDFLKRVWEYDLPTDEDAINAELKHTDKVIGNDKRISGLDIKWNCWQNNLALCPSPSIRSFHGILGSQKLAAMKEFLAKRN